MCCFPGVYQKIELLLVVILASVSVELIPTKPVQASNNVIVVNSLSDDQAVNGTCSQRQVICLRNAIATASSNPSATTINFSLDGTIMIGDALSIDSSNPMTIDARGQRVVIDGQKRNRIFNIGREAIVTINALTIQNGSVADMSSATLQTLVAKMVNPDTGSDGGGIFNAGMLTVNNCTLTDNVVFSSGGGLSNEGTATITNSTVSNNISSHGSGAGIYNQDGVLLISNTTIVGNTAWVFGGGIYSVVSGLTISNSTIAYNSASIGGGLALDDHGLVNLLSTIIAGNLLTPTKGSYPDLSPGSRSLGHNLIGDAPDDSDTYAPRNGINADQAGQDASPLNPKLDVLSSNGGLTQTIGLLVDSPAFGKGDCSGNPKVIPPAPAATTDQRGVSRRTPCAIGAYEGLLASSATLPATK